MNLGLLEITEWEPWLPYSRCIFVRGPVLPLLFFSLDLGFFCFIWGSGVFIENLGLFDSGQILDVIFFHSGIQ